MTRLILISSFIILFLVFPSLAQSPSCIEGEFLKGFGSPDKEKINKIYELENKLCNEIEEDSELQAIYGFAISPKFGQIVRIYKDKAVFTIYNDYARYQERTLNSKELEIFQNLLKNINLENQPPIRDTGRCTDMCSHYEFLSIDKNGGNRISIFSPRFRPPILLNSLAILFDNWIESGDFKTHYYIQDQIKGTKLIFDDKRFLAKAFWNKNDDFRILIFDSKKNWDDGLSWQKFANDNSGEIVSQPVDNYFLRSNDKKGCGRLMVVNRHPYQKQLGKYEVCVGVNNKEGLWKVYNDEEIKLIEKVPVNYSFVTPDQKWIIYGKAKDDRRNLYYLHYFNVETNKEFKVNLPPADFVGAEVYVKTHNKVLITRYQIEGQNRKNNPSPEKPVFYLLDLETGKIEEAKGEFRPLMQTYYRFLQPTKNPNEFWATIPDWENRTHTMFGIYNTENFTFTPLQKLSDILFNSNDMWVDEKEGKIYVVYDGHLLSLPLPTK